MRLLKKQLVRELKKNKLFLGLQLLLMIGTSFMYFFVHFSVDGNQKRLNGIDVRSEAQTLYLNALNSNETLARNILLGFISLTGFVLVMFYYNFFKSQKKQIGCLKVLGFTDRGICRVFLWFTIILSLVGGLIGFGGGYFASDILIAAGRESYQVTDTVKSIVPTTFITGIFMPMSIYVVITVLTYSNLRGKESGVLIRGNEQKGSFPKMLCIADAIASRFPKEHQFQIRLALRKPITILLIFISVMTFQIMFLLGYSLNMSSKTVFRSQTLGHYYRFDSDAMAAALVDGAPQEQAYYIDIKGRLQGNGVDLEWTIAGVRENVKVFELLDWRKHSIAYPKHGEIVLSEQLKDLYGFKKGDSVQVSIGSVTQTFTVSAIAFNAKTGWVYLSRDDMETMLKNIDQNEEIQIDAGVLSVKYPYGNEDSFITYDEKVDELRRNMVSNKVSAVINQVLGCVIGCILIFLALLMNFQTSTRDILILQMMGKEKKEIRKLLINLYQPIVILFYCLTVYPSILVVKAILRSLSLQIGDYMPFETNGWAIAVIFLLLNLIYYLVQLTFQLGIQRVTRKNTLEYASE